MTEHDWTKSPTETPISMRILDNLKCYAWTTDAYGKFTYISPVTILGVRYDHLVSIGTYTEEVEVHPDDREATHAQFRHCMATGDHFDGDYRMPVGDGTYRWFRALARPSRDAEGRIDAWYGTTTDIEDQKQLSITLGDRERKLQLLIDSVPGMTWSYSPDGVITSVNKRLLEAIGRELDDIIAGGTERSLVDIHPEDRDEMRAALAHSFATGADFKGTFRQRLANGTYRWTEARVEPLRDDAGTIIQWYGLCVDVHEMVSTRDALRAREQELRQLVETLPAMINCVTPDGELVFRSRQMREFLGYGLDDVGDETTPGSESSMDGLLIAGVHPDDLEGVKAHYQHSWATGEPFARRHRLRRFDGTYLWVETRAAAMRGIDGTITQWNVISLDIDGEVRAQEELRLAQERIAGASQAASLAELSASIAHEVNQPLAAVVANSYACDRWLSTLPPNVERAKSAAKRIVRDANAAADVISRIRALFKQAADARVSISPAAILADVRELMHDYATRRGCRLELEVENDLPDIEVDPVQIQQVLINLIRNGVEAMETVAPEPRLRIRVYRAGDTIRTEVIDIGVGLTSPKNIFDPFFTTKEDGMGIGLAICRTIVESHDGRLWAENNEPTGAKFVFTLPLPLPARIAP